MQAWFSIWQHVSRWIVPQAGAGCKTAKRGQYEWKLDLPILMHMLAFSPEDKVRREVVR
jgi:hypothetical protein